MSIPTKVCPSCKQEFPLTSEFWNKNSARKNGYHTYCIKCHRKIGRDFRLKNPEKQKEYSSRYEYLNPEKRKERNRRWAIKNPARRRELKRESYLRHSEYYKIRSKEYREKNIEKIIMWCHMRRAKKLNNGGSYTRKQIRELRLQQDNRCFHCGVSFDEKKMHVDHWIPISRGGSNDIGNIKLLCQHCNLSKKDKMPWEWDRQYIDDLLDMR